jgi:hypothetical protein
VDVIRSAKGSEKSDADAEDLRSVFVAVHEPLRPDEPPVIQDVSLHEWRGADAGAFRLRVKSAWGEYVILNGFRERPEPKSGFRGELAIVHSSPADGTWVLASEASAFRAKDLGFTGGPGGWSGRIASAKDGLLTCDPPRPEGWPTPPDGARQYVLVGSEGRFTGLPVGSVGERTIGVERFPLPPGATQFRLPALRVVEIGK